MKAKRILLAAIAFAGMLLEANAQAAVTAPILETIMSATHTDQIIYYAQSIAQLIENGTNTYNQFQNLLRAEQMALNNLKGISNVKSFDDFMTWYNRQLYLEQQSEKRFGSLGVKIGGRTYKVADVSDIPNAMQTEFVDYWGNEFSEQQKREMWINLGLTPANYAYVQTWKAREEDLAKRIMTKREIVNEENMAAAERENEMLKMLEEDAKLPEDQRMGEKSVAMMSLQAQLEANRLQRNAAYDRAEAEERRLMKEQAEKPLPNPPDVSDMWGTDTMFRPFSNDKF
jgi:hypothetical protein